MKIYEVEQTRAGYDTGRRQDSTRTHGYLTYVQVRIHGPVDRVHTLASTLLLNIKGDCEIFHAFLLVACRVSKQLYDIVFSEEPSNKQVLIRL